MRLAALIAALLVVVAGAVAAPARPASAADPGRWRLSSVDRIPPAYLQGLAPDGRGSLFWTGAVSGAYRSGTDLAEQLNLARAIPGFVRQADGLSQIGDPTWDPSQSGRLLLPLGCRSAGSPGGEDRCGRGALAVMDRGLVWRYRVLLDRAEIGVPGWAEVSPDGELVWTSSGSDLLAYRLADVTPEAAAAASPPLRAVRRLSGAVPISGVSGAAFLDGRLLLAGDARGVFQVWSVDVRDGGPIDARLEIERAITGGSEGLGAFDGLGGLLHWIVAPRAPAGRRPTYGTGRNALLTFVPAEESELTLTVERAALRAGRPALLVARVTQRFAGRSRPVAGASVSAGRWRARTSADGSAELRVRPLSGGELRVTARKQQLAPDAVDVAVLPPIGRVLTGLPRVRVSAGAGGTTLTARRLLDCSGSGGCEVTDTPRPRGCVALRGGSDLRIQLFRRPPREVSVLLRAGGTQSSGLARPGGRQGLGWTFPLRGAAARGRLELVLLYPDGTGALFAARTSPERC